MGWLTLLRIFAARRPARSLPPPRPPRNGLFPPQASPPLRRPLFAGPAVGGPPDPARATPAPRACRRPGAPGPSGWHHPAIGKALIPPLEGGSQITPSPIFSTGAGFLSSYCCSYSCGGAPGPFAIVVFNKKTLSFAALVLVP